MEIIWLRLFIFMCALLVNHTQNFQPPIGDFTELHSKANLTRLVNLTLNVL